MNCLALIGSYDFSENFCTFSFDCVHLLGLLLVPTSLTPLPPPPAFTFVQFTTVDVISCKIGASTGLDSATVAALSAGCWDFCCSPFTGMTFSPASTPCVLVFDACFDTVRRCRAAADFGMCRTRNVVWVATSVDLDSVVVVVVVAATGLVVYFLIVTLFAGGIFGCVGGFSTSLVIFDAVIDLVFDDAPRAVAALVAVGFDACGFTVGPVASAILREFRCTLGCGIAFILSVIGGKSGKNTKNKRSAFDNICSGPGELNSNVRNANNPPN